MSYLQGVVDALNQANAKRMNDAGYPGHGDRYYVSEGGSVTKIRCRYCKHSKAGCDSWNCPPNPTYDY